MSMPAGSDLAAYALDAKDFDNITQLQFGSRLSLNPSRNALQDLMDSQPSRIFSLGLAPAIFTRPQSQALR